MDDMGLFVILAWSAFAFLWMWGILRSAYANEAESRRRSAEADLEEEL